MSSPTNESGLASSMTDVSTSGGQSTTTTFAYPNCNFHWTFTETITENDGLFQTCYQHICDQEQCDLAAPSFHQPDTFSLSSMDYSEEKQTVDKDEAYPMHVAEIQSLKKFPGHKYEKWRTKVDSKLSKSKSKKSLSKQKAVEKSSESKSRSEQSDESDEVNPYPKVKKDGPSKRFSTMNTFHHPRQHGFNCACRCHCHSARNLPYHQPYSFIPCDNFVQQASQQIPNNSKSRISTKETRQKADLKSNSKKPRKKSRAKFFVEDISETDDNSAPKDKETR